MLHMLGIASPWLETDSNDPVVAEISAKVCIGMLDTAYVKRSSIMKYRMRVILV